MTLIVRGGEPGSIFSLLGADENSATLALGWVLEHSPSLRNAMSQAWFECETDPSKTEITFQKYGLDKGFSDLEYQAGLHCHAILEAKKGWTVPGLTQLQRYRPRLTSAGAEIQRIITVSSAKEAFVKQHLPTDVDGVQVIHHSWGDIQRMAKEAHSKAIKHDEKLWLRHFIQHLQEFVAMDRVASNSVYVVSLGSDPMIKGAPYTWIDVVEKDQSYFHPIEPGWPSQPPNYVGFRYRGRLQSIHHVDSFSKIRDLSTHNPAWSKTDVDHFVYHLGPAIKPASEIRTGKLFMNGRVHCAIDTLISGAFKTIAEARDETKRRLAASI